MQALKPEINYPVHKTSSVAGYIQRQTEKPFLFKILTFILELYFRFVGWSILKIKIKLFRYAGGFVFVMLYYSLYLGFR